MEDKIRNLKIEGTFPKIFLVETKVNSYLESLDLPFKMQAKKVLDKTQIISTDEVIERIERSLKVTLEMIDQDKFYVFINMNEIGWEHYFLHIFSKIFDLPNYAGLVTNIKGTEVPHINEVVDGVNHYNFINIDDCLYSGISQFGLLEETLSDIGKKINLERKEFYHRLYISKIDWYVVTAYCSRRANEFLLAEFPGGLHIVYDKLVEDVKLPKKVWKYDLEDYGFNEGIFTSTPIMFYHKISTDILTTFPQIYLDGYNPGTESHTGKLVNAISDRKILDSIESQLLNKTVPP